MTQKGEKVAYLRRTYWCLSSLVVVPCFAGSGFLVNVEMFWSVVLGAKESQSPIVCFCEAPFRHFEWDRSFSLRLGSPRIL